jgi:hypothetical protein
MSESETVTVTYGKWKVVLPWAAVILLGGAIGWFSKGTVAGKPSDDALTKIEAKVDAVDEKVDKVGTSVARIEGRLDEMSRPRSTAMVSRE